MEIRNNIKEEEKEWIVSQKWYHQRFDGCPHFLSFIGMAETKKEPRKPKGTEATIRICFFYDGKADWYILEDDNKRTTSIFLEKAKTDKDFTKKLMKDWEKDERTFYAACEEIENTDLTKLSNNQLIEIYERFIEVYLSKITSSSIIDGFALGSDRIVAEKIRTYLRSIGKDHDYNSLFSVLTAPVHLSFTNEAETELLKIALLIEKNAELKHLFLQYSEEETVTKLAGYPEIYNKLLNHQKKFFWLRNNYIDAHILSLEEFIFELKRILNGVDIGHELEFTLNHPKENKEKKGKLIKNLALPAEIVSLLHYSEDFTHWQDDRKKATFFASYYFSILLDEVARKTNFTLEELKYATPPEIKMVFDGSLSRKDLRNRTNGCAVAWKESEITIINGEEVSGLYEDVKRLDVPKDINVVKGLTASLGRVVGTAKIIKSAKEIGKIKEGDIIVAVMTRPDYVPAMKKAAAIVTEEGGITCHAAIVARELRIPCVIATKFATHVICDGDKIEVDANAGEVRILERAK